MRDVPDKRRKVEEPEPLKINVLQLTAPRRSGSSRVETKPLPRRVATPARPAQEEEEEVQSLHAPLVTCSGEAQPAQQPAGGSRVEDWRREFLTGAAELRAQIAVWEFQISQAKKRAELWEQLGSS